MPDFQYRAVDGEGKTVTGLLSAGSRDEAIVELGSMGYTPVSVSEKASGGGGSALFAALGRARPRDVAVLTRQLATLVRAGVPMMGSLTALVHQSQNEAIRDAMLGIRDDIEQGASLSSAMSRHPGVFDELYVHSVAAGETGGVLDRVLDRLAALLENEAETRANVRSAVLYPAVVVTALIGAAIVLLTFVVPRFERIYSASGVELPLPTRMILAVSHFTTGNWPLLLLAVVGAAAAFRLCIGTESGRLWWDGVKLRFPVLGQVFLKAGMTRFAHMFATLNRSGLPVLNTLQVLSHSIGNAAIAGEIRAMAESVRGGGSLSDYMEESRIFPPLVAHMVGVGEQAGALDELLEAVSSYYDTELRTTIRNLTALIEPILISTLAAVVLVFALAIFLPIWNIMSTLRH
jgi:type II secretory pathway component PulF